MFKPQFGCVQGLTAQRLNGRRYFGWQPIDLGGVSRSINTVSHQWMADMGHMHADLMGPASLELTLDTGDVPALTAEARLDQIMGNRLATILAHGLLQPIVLVASQRRINAALGRLGGAPDIGDIGPMQRAGAA